MADPNRRAPAILRGPALELAGFWRRLCALAIDMGVLAAVGIVVGEPFRERWAALGPRSLIIGWAIALIYFGIFEALSQGRTLGKRLLGIAVVGSFAGPLPAWRSTLRALLLVTPWFLTRIALPVNGTASLVVAGLVGTALFGVLPASLLLVVADRSRRQALHDLAVGAFVVRHVDGPARLVQARPSRTVRALAFGYAVAALIICVGVGPLVPWRIPSISRMLATREKLQALPGVNDASLFEGRMFWSGGPARRFVRVTLLTTQRPDDVSDYLSQGARVVLGSYPEAAAADWIAIELRRGYDIGLASRYSTLSDAHDAQGWRERIAAADARDARKHAVTEIAPAPVTPAAAPFQGVLAGAEGHDTHGYPTQYVDRPALRALLLRHRFAELTDAMEQLQVAFESDPGREPWVIDAAEALGTAEDELLPHLDAWVEARPDSFAPALARGTHWVNAAHNRRGFKWVRETSDADLVSMRQALARGLADLNRSLELRPNAVAALPGLLHAYQLIGDDEAGKKLIARGLDLCPSCFILRARYLHALEPRWGGSYAAMKKFIVRRGDRADPRTVLLPGYIDLDRAAALRHDKKYERALAVAEKACARGDHWEFLAFRADVKRRLGDSAGAIADLDRALALRPAHPKLLYGRAFALGAARRYEDAARDLRAALQSDPSDWMARDLRDPVVKGLIVEGWRHHEDGDREAALRVYDLATELDPSNAEVHGRRAWLIQNSNRREKAELEQRAASAPDDFDAVRQLDYTLAKNREYEKIVALWTDFLSRHPDHGQAHLERGGALHHLHRMPEAIADARRACDLGVTEACTIAKRIGAR